MVGCWHGYLSGARCRLAHGPADVTATRVVLDKGPLNVCVCVCVCGGLAGRKACTNSRVKQLCVFPLTAVEADTDEKRLCVILSTVVLEVGDEPEENDA